MHTRNIVQKGTPLSSASKVLIMLHGRGSTASDILSLSQYFNTEGFALIAPQATNHTWYPYSFMAPTSSNEPWLGAAIGVIDDIVTDLITQGFTSEQIYFAGFSQGACLTLEYTARHAKPYGGVIAFTGGLIGEQLATEQYQGDFKGTPIYIGTSDPDPHVPVSRVNESETILSSLNARVTKEIFPHMGHTINEREIQAAQQILHN
jgi:phospholipase/carboxylesterase